MAQYNKLPFDKASPYWRNRFLQIHVDFRVDYRIAKARRIVSRANRQMLNRCRRIAPDAMSAMGFLVNEMLKGRKEATE